MISEVITAYCSKTSFLIKHLYSQLTLSRTSLLYLLSKTADPLKQFHTNIFRRTKFLINIAV